MILNLGDLLLILIGMILIYKENGGNIKMKLLLVDFCLNSFLIKILIIISIKFYIIILRIIIKI